MEEPNDVSSAKHEEEPCEEEPNEMPPKVLVEEFNNETNVQSKAKEESNHEIENQPKEMQCMEPKEDLKDESTKEPENKYKEEPQSIPQEEPKEEMKEETK